MQRTRDGSLKETSERSTRLSESESMHTEHTARKRAFMLLKEAALTCSAEEGNNRAEERVEPRKEKSRGLQRPRVSERSMKDGKERHRRESGGDE
eukprot:6174589-Pleurochrysis_carterae.AAC.3